MLLKLICALVIKAIMLLVLLFGSLLVTCSKIISRSFKNILVARILLFSRHS